MGQTEQCFETPESGSKPVRRIVLPGRASLSAGAVALLLAASLAACGSSDSDSDSASTAARTTQAATTAEDTTADDTAADSGIADKSADEILADAKVAAQGANAVHVSGTVDDVTLDLDLVKGKGAAGSITQGANEFEIVTLGGEIFLKGSAAFYRQVGGPAAVRLLKDKWLKVPAGGEGFAGFEALTDMDMLLTQALKPEGTISKGDVETVDGAEAVGLTSSRGRGTLYVAATGEPYPLQLAKSEAGGGKVVFSRWGEPAELTAPTDAVDISEFTSQAG